MASKTEDITREDIYALIGVNEDASEKDITKAYRKQALKCHPDKNPDNPKAAEQFHKLTRALEVLSDAAARAAYDKILKAKKAAQHRQKQFDSKRKKFKDDLEARERAVGEEKEDADAAARRLQQEIERLRKEGNKILQETQEQLERDLKEKQSSTVDDQSYSGEKDQLTAKIKVKWKIKKGQERDEGYTVDELRNIFSKFGEVLNIVLSVKKSGTAIIEFASPYTAELAVKTVTGKKEFPLTLSWLSGQPPHDMHGNIGTAADTVSSDASDASSLPSFSSASYSGPATVDNKDFENVVLMKMRQAEERKRLIEEMMKEDEAG